MAKVLIRKPKRATLLTKRSACMGKKFREKSHKLLYENIKRNNSYLAKALSHEKQNNQNLFKQNLSLFAEIQNLNLTCNKQANLITNIQNNAKEMLKMLVTMTSFLTNTLTMCQEFVASNTAARLSSIPTGRKDLSKTMSPKSPAKGVVKPMVSGHTITKPTINLSRINTENITNISRLSIVQEVLSPERSEENENRSSITTPFTTSTLRYENNRRMPERIRISSPRVNDAEADNGQIRQRRSRHSRRMGSYTRLESERWSVGETPRHSRDRISIGSPRVKLRDVSKLLQDSRTINIRRLIGSRIDDIEMQESSNDVPQDTSERNIIAETQMSINLNEEDESYVEAPKANSDAKTRKVSEKTFDRTLYTAGSSRQNNSRDWEEDPLEGPSWLFSNTLNMPSRDNEPEELDRSHDFDVNNNSEVTYADSSDAESIEDQSRNLIESSINGSMNTLKRERSVSAPVINHVECESPLSGDDNTDNNICEAMSTMSDRERNDEENETSYPSFITLRRGHSEVIEEEEDDFTLMLTCPTPQNLQFDINDLRLPDENTVTNSARETEINNTMSNISFVLNQSEHARTIKQPLILASHNDEIASTKKKQQKNKKAKTSKLKDEINQSESGSKMTKKTKQKLNSESSRDPSAAKVVLEKLSDSHIKPRLSDDDMDLRRTNDYTTDMDNQGDSQALNSENQRPKRRNMPVTLKEPSLRKKLRRD